MNNIENILNLLNGREAIDNPSLMSLLRDTDFTTIGNDNLDNCYSNSFNRDIILEKGVILTPKYIADFMVNQALYFFKSSGKNLHWYDPCCGSGIFPVSIIKNAIPKGEMSEITYDDLPIITINEISPIGLYLSLCNINITLKKHNLNVVDYIASKRLYFSNADTLTLNPENLSFESSKPRKFDIVIGNPPYVRSTRLSKEYKTKIASLYPSSFKGNADLYTYFIASGILNLTPGGYLCFISPANFFRSTSGAGIRKFIERKCVVKRIIDLDEIKIFEDATIHSTIYTIQRLSEKTNSSQFDYTHLTDEGELSKIKSNTLEFKKFPSKNLNKDGWIIETGSNTNVLKIYNNECKPLTDFGFRVYSGIRTGYQKAFIYSEQSLVSYSDAETEKWFKPCLRGKKIIKWWTGSDTEELILLTSHDQTPEIPNNLKELLLQHKDRLSTRPEVGGNVKWFHLRPCSYYNTMKQDKIVFPDITSKARFSYDTNSLVVLDGGFFIPTNDLCLLGILNSDIAWHYFVNYCSSIGNPKNKGRVRIKKTVMNKFPLPQEYTQRLNERQEIGQTVENIISNGENEKLIHHLNFLVKQFYGIK